MVSFVPRPSWDLKKNLFNDPSFRSLFLTGKPPIYRIHVNSYPVISPFSIPVVGEKPGTFSGGSVPPGLPGLPGLPAKETHDKRAHGRTNCCRGHDRLLRSKSGGQMALSGSSPKKNAILMGKIWKMI